MTATARYRKRIRAVWDSDTLIWLKVIRYQEYEYRKKKVDKSHELRKQDFWCTKK